MRWILRFRIYVIVFLAVLLILSAVTFSMLRAALPHATGYKNEIQLEISKLIGLPVEIQSIDAAIHWFSPRLKLIGVSIYDKDNEDTLFNFEEAFVQLDVIASLLHRDFIVDDIGLIGTDISIEKLSENEWSVQGIKITNEGASEIPAAFLYMLQNSDYLLHDSKIFYQDHTGDKLSLALIGVNIDVSNDFNNHNLKISIRLPDNYGQDLSIVANLRGDLDSLYGDIYLEAKQLKINQWNQTFKLLPEYQIDTILDINLWLSLDDGNIEQIASQLLANDLYVKNIDTAQSWKTNHLSTNIRFSDDKNRRTFIVTDFYFGDQLTPDWPSPVNMIAYEDDNNYSLSADYLNLGDLQEVVKVFLDKNILPDFNKLNAYELKSDVYNMNLILPKEATEQELQKKLYLQASVNDLSVYDSKNKIRLTGLDASLLIDEGRASIDLVSQDTIVEMPAIFRNPLLANILQGEINVYSDADGWHINSESVQLKNDHINSFSRLDIKIPASGNVFLDVQTDFYDAYGKYATYYLPVGVMSDALVDWLDMAITDGYITNGQLILHGDLADFPYDKHDGVFQAVFDANNVNMRFLEGWPLIKDASASVRFNNKSLQVKDANAKTQGADLFNGYAEINDLMNAHLTVKTNAKARNEDVQTYIWQSPLDDVLGNAMRLFQFSGDSKLDLTLDVPLENDNADVAINGHINFNNTNIYYPALGYEIKAINGVVDFTKDSIFADTINANIQGENVLLNAFTRDGKSGREVVFHLDGKMQVDYLLQHYDWIPENWVSGKSKLSLDLEVPYQPKDYQVHIKAETDLQGVDLRLSDKVYKSAADKLQFTVAIDVLENNGLQAKASAEIVNGDNLVDSNKLVNNKLASVDADSANTDKVSVENLEADNVFKLYAVRDTSNVWNFDVNSAYIAGKGEFSEGLEKDTTVNLDLEKIDLYALYYNKNVVEAESEQLNPGSFPQLSWKINNLYWDEWKFSKVVLETDWHKHGMLINKFSLKAPAMTFDARGTWLTSWRNTQETVLQGVMTSSDFGETLTGFGFERSINHGTVNATFDAKWPAAPYVLSWSGMEGVSSFEMKKGEILEVEPGAGGRLLGLLNIFELTNRLVFDFDDVTHKGFSFDYIKGEFEFVDGNGSLNNFDVSAPSADVNMFGSIGLLKHDYGLLMHVKPHTDTLTFAGGALLGGVAVGAGLALIQKVFDLGVLGHTVYSISGSWDNPEIEKIVQKTLDDDEEF